jgi:Na+/H+ antiporter NhaD/arsenite permease-like protein
MGMGSMLILALFTIGYLAIIFEYSIKIHKTAAALAMAVACWAVYFIFQTPDMSGLSHHVSEISQIIFFLVGAMTLVELIDAHGGFKRVTDLIDTASKKKLLWIVSLIAFFLSSVIDNLTTTILMVSLLRKLVPAQKERLDLCCMVVIAANAGGAWTPIGDVTTTMLWINGQLSSFAVMKALLVPSLLAMLIPLCWFTWRAKGSHTSLEPPLSHSTAGSTLVFYAGIAALISVPAFKALTGLPPFMGILISLAALWVITDLMHHKYEERHHLRVPHVLTRIDTSGILFFLGILLAVSVLETAGFLADLSQWLDQTVGSLPLIATSIGLSSAVIDNVPLVAASMGMYSLERFPQDSSFWHMIAYAAGTGGSILIIGSSSGVALMGMEKIDFFTYLKKAALPALIGYLAGMAAYLILV